MESIARCSCELEVELARPYSTQLVAVCASPTDAIRGIAVHLIGQFVWEARIGAV